MGVKYLLEGPTSSWVISTCCKVAPGDLVEGPVEALVTWVCGFCDEEEVGLTCDL